MRLDSVVAALVCGVIVLFSPADARSATVRRIDDDADRSGVVEEES